MPVVYYNVFCFLQILCEVLLFMANVFQSRLLFSFHFCITRQYFCTFCDCVICILRSCRPPVVVLKYVDDDDNDHDDDDGDIVVTLFSNLLFQVASAGRRNAQY